ncbi:MAG: hypothetical protein CMJ78_02755, partial [Planctomycetaceae bacterium]|nr:hypothetical protein [Planctomycetaceae bacterium]
MTEPQRHNAQSNDAVADELSDDDQVLCELLDQYLNASGHDRDEQRRGLIEQHPQLADLVGTIDDLDHLAVASDAASTLTDPFAVHPESFDISSQSLPLQSLPTQFGKYELVHELG